MALLSGLNGLLAIKLVQKLGKGFVMAINVQNGVKSKKKQKAATHLAKVPTTFSFFE